MQPHAAKIRQEIFHRLGKLALDPTSHGANTSCSLSLQVSNAKRNAIACICMSTTCLFKVTCMITCMFAYYLHAYACRRHVYLSHMHDHVHGRMIPQSFEAAKQSQITANKQNKAQPVGQWGGSTFGVAGIPLLEAKGCTKHCTNY